MAWALWLVLTVLAFAASWLVSVAVFDDRSSGERAIGTWLLFPALILLALQSVGYVGWLTPGPLAVASMALFGSVALVAFRHAGGTKVRATLLYDVRAPVRVLIDAWQEREPMIIAVLFAVYAFAITLLIVWFYKSWTWDPLWYHVPITSYAIQNHSLGWIATDDFPIRGYARNVEWLSIWNCIFPRDNRFDDTGQLPFCFLGAFVVANWARRLGVSRALAVGLGAAWFALPPVFLQSYTTHVDVAVGALFPTAMYFASFEESRRNRWFAFIALGLYIGTKFTGVFHAALLAPWIFVRDVREIWRARGERLVRVIDTVGSMALACALGIGKYVQNFLHTGNPMFPFRTEIPVLHAVWPGPQEVGDLWGSPHGVDPSFFRVPGDFARMIGSWFDDAPFYAPDVRSGGFGAAFRWVLLPCMAIIASELLLARSVRRLAPIIAMFVMGVVVPAAWWPRFTIASASASLLAFAWVHRQVPRRWLRTTYSVALIAFVGFTFYAAQSGYIAFPKHFAEAVAANSAAERASLQLDTFHWTREQALQREHELRAGDVFAYDSCSGFVAEYFNHDYRTNVTFVSSGVSSAEYLATLRRLRARWVSVTRGSAAERAVRSTGATFLFGPPGGNCGVWRMPVM